MLKGRANVLCVLQILKEHSDEEHIMPMRDLIGKMAEIYEVTVDRRTIYGAVETLNAMGYDISTYEENGKGYYLRSRELDISEIRLLTDAVFSFASASPVQKKKLVSKLQNLLSIYQRQSYRHMALLPNDKVPLFEDLFYTIDLLDAAIGEKRKVSFSYLTYTFDKTLAPRRQERSSVSPYGMLCANGHYYLICIVDGRSGLMYYRIDKISDLKILKQSAAIPPKDLEIFHDNSGNPSLCCNALQSITLRCDASVLSDVLDQFGLDTVILRSKEKSTFDAIVKAPAQQMKKWALQYMRFVEVISPPALRKEILLILEKNAYANSMK